MWTEKTKTCALYDDFQKELPLYVVDAEAAKKRGAVCLDGSPPGYYAGFATTPARKTSWILYFKGGAWCFDEANCAARAKTELGSSKLFPKTLPAMYSGMLDADPSINPEFHDFNRVLFWYCDGASFSGNRNTPYYHAKTKQNLYFRGARVLNILLDTLISKHGLDRATDVLLAGGSAGGLSTFLHTDYVHKYLLQRKVPLRRFKAAPLSGFFLMHKTEAGRPTYADKMKKVFEMQHASVNLNAKCIASYDKSRKWRCMFANESYAHTEVPMFVMNSAVDSYQLGAIWNGDIYRKGTKCSKNNFETCSKKEVASVNGWLRDFVRDLKAPAKFRKPGEGGFVESCLEHVAPQGSLGFTRYKIRGVTLRDALSKWWASTGKEPSANHWYLPCELNTAKPHQCNPTCSFR